MVVILPSFVLSAATTLAQDLSHDGFHRNKSGWEQVATDVITQAVINQILTGVTPSVVDASTFASARTFIESRTAGEVSEIVATGLTALWGTAGGLGVKELFDHLAGKF